MPDIGSPRVRARTWKDPFSLRAKRTDLGREVLAGVMGWMTVVSSVAFYAKLFVGGEEGVDQDATVETFELVAGLSSIAFGAAFNVPFIVAPSVLYAPREDGMEMGEHLADQLIANLAAALFFALALKLSFVSFIPTALRLGAGCGISMLVSVLGLRSLGLLVANSFTLQPFTWQNIVGLAVITASCSKSSGAADVTKKWMFVILAPTILTILVYAVGDRSKFQGYATAENTPLSNWGDGSFGMASFDGFLSHIPNEHWFYVVRLIFSITINVSSVLLVLIDAVCLEEVHTKVKSSGEVDFSNAIGGTKKFRVMASSIPLMSALGNLMGVTTQAAFVQSMMLVFAGGRTGLSAVVTGVMFVLSTVLWPLLPVLVPGHVSGALTVVISLRFFTVIRMIDVTCPSNLLMFGMSILLIPLSFDFVNALCIATVLGFLCEVVDKLERLWSARRSNANKVAVTAVTAVSDATGKDGIPLASGPDAEAGEATSRAGDTSTPGVADVLGAATTDALLRPKFLSNPKSHSAVLQIASAPVSPTGERAEPLPKGSNNNSRSPRNVVLPPIETTKTKKQHEREETMTHRGGWGTPSSSKYVSLSSPPPPRSPRDQASAPVSLSSPPPPRSPRDQASAPVGPRVVHWGLALVAATQLVLSVVRAQTLDTSDDE